MKSDKLFLGIIFLTFSSLFFQLYSQRVPYAYDAAGNRISRTIILSRNNAQQMPQEEDARRLLISLQQGNIHLVYSYD